MHLKMRLNGHNEMHNSLELLLYNIWSNCITCDKKKKKKKKAAKNIPSGVMCVCVCGCVYVVSF